MTSSAGHSAADRFWFDDPQVLWKPKGGLEKTAAWWPFDASLQGRSREKKALRCNAATRLIAAGTAAVFALGGFDLRALVVGAIALALVTLSYAAGEASGRKKTSAGAHEALLEVGTPRRSDAPFLPMGARHRDPWEFIPTRNDPTPDLLPSSAVAPDADENPFRNPLPYAAPGAEVRTERATYDPEPEPWLNKIYRGSDDTPMDWYAHKLPDTSLMARPVYWNFHPQPDIVSAQARVADRWMTY